MAANKSPEKAVFEFLQTAIDEQQQKGSKAIDRPAYLKTLDDRGVTLESMR